MFAWPGERGEGLKLQGEKKPFVAVFRKGEKNCTNANSLGHICPYTKMKKKVLINDLGSPMFDYSL